MWLLMQLTYEDNDDKTETIVSSPMMRTAADALVSGGMHYCKLLSPLRALEWIYVDSLKERDGLNSVSDLSTI